MSDYMPLWSVNQCAQALGISMATIYAWVHQQRIPHIKIGSALRFDPERIRQWVEEQAREPNTRGARGKDSRVDILPSH